MENIMLPKPHRILSIQKETPAEYTFRAEYSGTSRPGQFCMLSIPKFGEAPISISEQQDGYIEFTISKVGRLTEGVFGLKEGDTLFMRGPYGNSYPMEDLPGKDLVVICGGVGMASVRTLLKDALRNPGKYPSVHLLAGFKDLDSVLFTEELEQYRQAFHTVTCLDTMEAPDFRKGFVTQYVSEIPFGDFADYNVIVCGPPTMMKFTALECVKNGAAPEKMWMSFSRRMSCAVGKCGHCKINEVYVCQEGPVFNYTFAKDLLD